MGGGNGDHLDVLVEPLHALGDDPTWSFVIAEMFGAAPAAIVPTPGTTPSAEAAWPAPARIGCIRCQSRAAFSVQSD